MTATTDDQLVLDLGEVVTPEVSRRASLQEQFEAFHAANPWVYVALERIIRDWLNRGHDRAGVKQAYEVLRWQHGRAVDVTGTRPLKVNNNHTSRYARLLIERNPTWVTAISTRVLRAT